MAKKPKNTIWAYIWRWFSNFCVTLVVCFFVGWLIAVFSDPVFVKQSDGSYVERTRWVGFQQVYILSVPGCKEGSSDCLAVPEYKDSVSAAYQLGRLDYVTIAVALLAVAITILGIFGFSAVKEKAELRAKKAAEKVAQKKIGGIATKEVNDFLRANEGQIFKLIKEVVEERREAMTMVDDTNPVEDESDWAYLDTSEDEASGKDEKSSC